LSQHEIATVQTTSIDETAGKARLLLMSRSHVVSYGSAICPIMPSTASVAMKPLFGVKLGRFYLRSTIWIAASHRRECGVSVLG
jgi:hypothetical protein